MMKPSEEGRELADYIISEILQDPRHDDIVNQVATAIDNHTAALRAEVEALRARVMEQEDLVTVREWIQKYGGVLNENGVILYSPEAIATRIDLIHNDKNWLHAAAQWIKNQQ